MAKKKEFKDIYAVAEKYGINSDNFRDYIHKQKDFGRRGAKNSKGDFTRKQLEYLAKEFLDEITDEESENEAIDCLAVQFKKLIILLI